MGKISDRAREFESKEIPREEYLGQKEVIEEQKKVRPIDKLLKRKEIPKKDQLVMEKIDISRDFILPSEQIAKIDDKINQMMKHLEGIDKNLLEIINFQEKLRSILEE